MSNADFTPVHAATFFSNTPDVEAQPIGIPIRRTPVSGSAGGIILSDDILGCYTHFWQGRTRPCAGPACNICAEGIARRWHAWFVTKNKHDSHQFLVEVPAGPALALAAWRKENFTLRGWLIKLSRANKKVNGRVIIEMSGPKVDSMLLPPCPDVPGLLLRMWQVKNGQAVIDIIDEPRVYDGDEDVSDSEMTA
jgi:hypothetical protein